MESDRVSALVAPLVEMLAPEVGEALRAELEKCLRGEARSLEGALDQGMGEKDLRDLLVRQVELEVLEQPAEKRGEVLRSWSSAHELVAKLHPLGVRSRDLVRDFRAKGRTEELKAAANALLDETVTTARAAAPAALAREGATVTIILMNCATVLTDGLLGLAPGGPR